MVKNTVCVMVVTLIIGFSPRVYAFFEAYGAGVRANAMGGAYTAVADDASAAFYNPAGLAQCKTHKLTLEYFYCKPELKVKNTDGGDLIVEDATGLKLYEPVYGWSGTNEILAPVIGLQLSINEMIKSITKLPFNTQLGVLAGIPDNGIKTWEMTPMSPDIPQFIVLGDPINHMNGHFSLASELVEDLFYVGVGGVVALNATADIISPEAKIATQHPTIFHGTLSADFAFDLQAGVLVTPFDKMLRLGFAYKQETMLTIDPLQLYANIPFGGTIFSIPLKTCSIISYRPEEYDFGLAVELEKVPFMDLFPIPFKSLLISTDVCYQKWSEYKYDSTTEYYMDAENSPHLIESSITQPDFEDTTEIKVGMRYAMNDNYAGMIGFQHLKSPIPDQSHRITNYLDVDRDVYSAGCTYTFSDWPVTLSGSITYSIFDGFYVDNSVAEDPDEMVIGLSWGREVGNSEKSFTVSDGSIFTIGVGASLAF